MENSYKEKCKKVKNIKTTKIKKYLADIVKHSQDLNMIGKSKYLFTCIDRFSKFEF